MKVRYLVIAFGLVITACGPSSEQLTATVVMAKAQTQTAAPTSTPTATLTPTMSPTLTPTPTVTPSPTPSIPKVQGKIQVNFVPLDDKTIIPQPPFDLAMKLSPASGGKEIQIQATDEAGNFYVYLEAGQYTIDGLEIKTVALGSDPAELIADQNTFTVPSDPCYYAGEFTFTVVRLPPGSFEEQIALVQELAKGQPVGFKFYETGGFLMPALTEIAGAGACPDLPEAPEGFNWKYLPESSLAVLSPNDWFFKSEKNEDTRSYFISLENTDEVGSFKTGMSINVIQDNKINAIQAAKDLPAEILSDKKVTKTGELIERTEGILQFYEFQHEASFPTYDGTVYNMLVANESTNTLYIISFESPTGEWDEAWTTGRVMIEQMKFFEIK